MSSQPDLLRRCKSECDISDRRPWDGFRGCRSSEDSEAPVQDSGSEDERAGDDGVLATVERKIDRLHDLFVEQCSLLAELREDLRESRAAIDIDQSEEQSRLTAALYQAFHTSDGDVKHLEPVSLAAAVNSRARSLLDAIEMKQGFNIDRQLRSALLDCLQSDELKDRMVSATTVSVRKMVGARIASEMSRLYMPVMQRTHRRLASQLNLAVDAAFAELESNAARLTNSMCRVSRSLRRALDRHQASLDAASDRCDFNILRTLEETIQREVQQWRHKAVEAFVPNPNEDEIVEWVERGATPPLEYPISPPQPVDCEGSIIDQLMTTAEINKLIQDGKINAAFECALSAANLSMVMTACRAVNPVDVFSPCQLEQSTLLSLAQQLPTDMVHETQLKCRYLEEALMNLNRLHSATIAHLPLVVSEVRRHLTKFLVKFPKHFASRRITLIIMVADNLIK